MHAYIRYMYLVAWLTRLFRVTRIAYPLALATGMDITILISNAASVY
jgi:hypothetical protein